MQELCWIQFYVAVNPLAVNLSELCDVISGSLSVLLVYSLQTIANRINVKRKGTISLFLVLTRSTGWKVRGQCLSFVYLIANNLAFVG